MLPSVIRGNAADGYGMRYDELIPVLIKAIQEQQAMLAGNAPSNEEVDEPQPNNAWLALAFLGGRAAATVAFGVGRRQ